MTLTPGTLLNNRYRIVSILGQGGMGSVYQAWDENLGISVAVKENQFLTDEYARQFQREANILASLRHPSLPRVGDYFSVPNQGQYLIMDFIEGEDLRERIERITTLPDEEVILIGAAICDALNYLHHRYPPIIHRDIKPGNIKITPEGQVSLVDFGLAKLMIGTQQTTTGARAMTPGYSPPEQYGTAPTDSRTDIYSLGATLYAAFTGAIPEDGLARATGKADLTPVRALMPKANRKLASVIEKALEVDPDDRYQTAVEFRKALLNAGNMERLPEGQSLVTPPPYTPPPEEMEPVGATLAFGYNSTPQDPMVARRLSLPVSRRNRARKMMPISLVIIGVIALIAILQPGIPQTVLGWIISPPAATSTLAAANPEVTLTSSPPAGTPEATSENPSPTDSLTGNESKTPAPVENLTPTITPTPTPTKVGGSAGQIAFSSDRTGSMQVWLMNTDGSQQRPLTNLPDGACKPAWSPDGAKLAFISPCKERKDRYDGSKIFVLDVTNESAPYPLPVPPSPAEDYDPVWSPDGNRIAFSSTRAGNPDVFVFNLKDQSLIQLTNNRAPEKYPVWSPSGTQIAFVRDISYSQLWIMSDTGQYQSRFSVSGEVNDMWPNWSPDGNYILFSQLNSANVPWLVSLRYEDRNTTNSTRIPPRGQPDVGPVAQANISPDGNWIAYESWPDGSNHDIYLMTINGSNKMRLTTDKDFDFGPAWRPVPKS
ncbi:MAG: WD40 repeat domain-containing serine/threonine protein kinase [Bellilinea sp.]